MSDADGSRFTQGSHLMKYGMRLKADDFDRLNLTDARRLTMLDIQCKAAETWPDGVPATLAALHGLAREGLTCMILDPAGVNDLTEACRLAGQMAIVDGRSWPAWLRIAWDDVALDVWQHEGAPAMLLPRWPSSDAEVSTKQVGGFVELWMEIDAESVVVPGIRVSLAAA